jgi:hypothetical protein
MYITPIELITIGLLLVIFSKQIVKFPPWKKPYLRHSNLGRYWVIFIGVGFIAIGLFALSYF